MCTVRATSSHITAALTAALAVVPMVNDAVVLHQHRRRAMITQGLDDAAADRVVADQGERADRDLPTELVGHHGQDAGNRLSAGSPGGGVGRVRVDHTADLGHVLVDIGMCGRVGGRVAVAVDEIALEIGDHHRLRGELVVAHSRRLDHQQVVAGHPGRHVAGGPDHETPARQLGVQLRNLGAERGHDIGDLGGDGRAVLVHDLSWLVSWRVVMTGGCHDATQGCQPKLKSSRVRCHRFLIPRELGRPRDRAQDPFVVSRRGEDVSHLSREGELGGSPAPVVDDVDPLARRVGCRVDCHRRRESGPTSGPVRSASHRTRSAARCRIRQGANGGDPTLTVLVGHDGRESAEVRVVVADDHLRALADQPVDPVRRCGPLGQGDRVRLG